jgi:hypothetical protein
MMSFYPVSISRLHPRAGLHLIQGKIPFSLIWFLFLIFQEGRAQTSVFTFDTPGEQFFNFPSGTTRYQVEAWGGGGDPNFDWGGNGGDYMRYTTINAAQYHGQTGILIKVGAKRQASGFYLSGIFMYANQGKDVGNGIQNMPVNLGLLKNS